MLKHVESSLIIWVQNNKKTNLFHSEKVNIKNSNDIFSRLLSQWTNKCKNRNAEKNHWFVFGNIKIFKIINMNINFLILTKM